MYVEIQFGGIIMELKWVSLLKDSAIDLLLNNEI